MYGIRQMTMEQLFIRLLYEDWGETRFSYHNIDKTDAKNSIRGGTAWFLDLEKFCQNYENQSIAKRRHLYGKDWKPPVIKGADRTLFKK